MSEDGLPQPIEFFVASDAAAIIEHTTRMLYLEDDNITHITTELGLSTIVHAIRGSRVIFQRIRSYSIYSRAVMIRIVVCFAILAFAFKFDFPPFMVLIIALLNDGTIMTLSVDRVLPSNTPDSWDLAEIFAYALAYGLYLTLSTIALIVIIICITWFADMFGAALTGWRTKRLVTVAPNSTLLSYL